MKCSRGSRRFRQLSVERLECRRVLAAIVNGEVETGSFATGQSDGFEFTASQDEFVRVAVVDLTGTTGNSQPKPILQIVDPGGNILTSSSTGEQLSGRDDDSSFFQFAVQADGEYTAIISEQSNDQALVYSIRLLVLPGDPVLIEGQDEFLDNGEEFVAALPVNGMNVHQFDVQESDLVHVSIGNLDPVGGSSYAGPRLQIIDPTGKRVSIGGDLVFGDVEQARAQFTATMTGRYTALVLEEDSNAPLDYRIRLFTLPGTPNPIPGRDGTLVNGAVTEASFELGGMNYHRFTASQDEFIRVAVVDLTGTTGNSQPEPILQIVGPDGNILTSSSPGEQLSGRDDDSSFFQFVVQADGEYTAIISELSNDQALDYSIRLLALPGDPVLIDGQDEFLDNGEEFVAALPLNGMNVHQFDVQESDLVYVSVGNLNPVGGNTYAGPRLQIIDPTGKRVSIGGDVIFGNVEQALAQFTATMTGRYTALMLEEDSNAALDYRIRLFTLPGTPNPIPDRDGTLVNGVATEASFELGTFAFFTFDAISASEVTIDVRDTMGGSDASPAVQIFSVEGELIADNADSELATVTFVPAVDSVYYALVSESLNDSPLSFAITASGIASLARVVSVGSASQTGSEDGGTLTLDVNISAASATDVTVPFTVRGTATDGDDYTITSSPVTIAAGQTSATVTITVVDDVIDESAETVIVSLGTPTGADLGSSTVHMVTIIDNDAPPPLPTVSVSGSSQTGAEDVGTLTFDVNLSVVSATDVTVPLTVTGTATDGNDYTITSSPVTIAAGQTSATVTITVVDDVIDESDETVIVTLGAPTGADLGSSTVHTATIIDNDDPPPPPTVSVSHAAQAGAEDAGTLTFDVKLSAASATDVTVPFTVTGTAIDGDDYMITSSPVTIAAGQTSATVTITVVDDVIDESDETVIVTLGAPTGADLGSSTIYTATIIDNDDPPPPPTVSVSRDTQTGPEDVGTLTFDVELSAASTTDVTVPFTVMGTATDGDDYAITLSPVTIAAGQTSATVTITVVDDVSDEGDETIVVSLGKPTGAELGNSTVHTATIVDNDPAPLPTVSVGSATQAGAEDVGTLTFDVNLSAASATDVTVPFTVTGTAIDGNDYTITSSPVTIATGQSSATVTISVIDDVSDEGDETIVVSLGRPTGAELGSSTVHTVTIVDNDTPPQLPTVSVSHTTQTGSEDVGTLTFDVKLSAASATDVTIPFTVTGTATDGDDYTITSSPVAIAAGQTSATVTITVVADGVSEVDETVVVTLLTPTNAELGEDFVHVATITDGRDPFIVTTTDDIIDWTDSETSLREAIATANSSPGEDVVTFANQLSGQEIILLGTELLINDATTIDASSLAERITINADGRSRVLHFRAAGELPKSSASLWLKGVQITGGKVSGNNPTVDGQVLTMHDGGGIRFDSSGVLTIEDSSIRQNMATGDTVGGGGVFVGSGSLRLLSSSLTSNHSSWNGGGILATTGSVDLISSTISENENTSLFAGGGAVYADSGDVSVQDSWVSENVSLNGAGGAIQTGSGDVVLTRSEMVGNTARFSGGGIRTGSGNVTVLVSSIESNSTQLNGGAISTHSGDVTITSSTISENVADANGGGIFTTSGAASLLQSTVSGNAALQDGGAMMTYYGDLFVSSSTISLNRSSLGTGGIVLDPLSYADKESLTLRNSIVAQNTGSGDAGDILAPASDGIASQFSLIGNNTGVGIAEAQTADAHGNIVGTTDNPVDPLLSELASFGGLTKTQRLLSGSPAINAGAPDGMLEQQPFDQRGEGFPRMFGGRLDMGAVESLTPVVVESLVMMPPDAGYDPPDLQGVDQPASWSTQRSELHRVVVNFNSMVTTVSVDDVQLTNLGVDSPNDPDAAITLMSQQIVFHASSHQLIISLRADQLSDGVYQLQLFASHSTYETIVITGNPDNRFYTLRGDFDGNGLVGADDVTTIGYWLDRGVGSVPGYVDPNGDGSLEQSEAQLFAGLLNRRLIFPDGSSAASDIDDLTPKEKDAFANSLNDPLDVDGDGEIIPLDALLVINHLNLLSRNGELGAKFAWDRRDVSRDFQMDAFDALLVINHLNLQARLNGQGSDAPVSSTLRQTAPQKPNVRSVPLYADQAIIDMFGDTDDEDEELELLASLGVRDW
ncbi:Calx-beta domain-containing protein [Roseimaritima ulvae]|uniref:Calx-beta domain protein n=1 Tax=Roseimaritima ulvae TaxID=980254 RepID=A0A5B9R928_9BACT|nr:Calx-beta domain-containing protein [Roseimaritima ulvae]QEG43441.1 Calx-beta domain protein [Roseimaritima ulvae]